MVELNVLDHILFGAFCLFGVIALLRGKHAFEGMTWDTPTKLSMYWSNSVVLWVGAFVTIGIWVLGGHTLEEIGLTLRQESVALGLGLSAAFGVSMGIDSWLQTATPARRKKLLAHWDRYAPFLPSTSREFGHFSVLSLTAGITEEIMMRGFFVVYLVSVLGDSTGALVLVLSVPAVLFAVLHRYQGWKAMIRIVILSLFFCGIFLATKSILIPMVLHFLVDAFGGYVAFRMTRQPPVDAVSA